MTYSDKILKKKIGEFAVIDEEHKTIYIDSKIADKLVIKQRLLVDTLNRRGYRISFKFTPKQPIVNAA